MPLGHLVSGSLPPEGGDRASAERAFRQRMEWGGEDDAPPRSPFGCNEKAEASPPRRCRRFWQGEGQKASVTLSGGRRSGPPGKAARSRVRTIPGSSRFARTRVLLISPA